MYQSRRAGDETKKRKSPAKSVRVGIYANLTSGISFLRYTTAEVRVFVTIYL